MKKHSDTLEIEVDNNLDQSFFCAPLGRVVRGRLSFLRLAERSPNAMMMEAEVGRQPIPGEVIGIDRDGTIYIREPLHEDGNKKLRVKLAERGYKFQDEKTTFPDADYDRCLSAMARAVKAGVARVISGSLPDEIPVDPDSKPRVDPHDEQLTTLVGTVTSLVETVNKLVARVGLN